MEEKKWDAEVDNVSEEMSDVERAGHALARREAELAERERRLNERELRTVAMGKLAERGLPMELAEALSYNDEEKCFKTLDAVEHAFRHAVQLGVDERLRGEVPTAGQNAMEADTMSDDAYYRMRYRV